MGLLADVLLAALLLAAEVPRGVAGVLGELPGEESSWQPLEDAPLPTNASSSGASSDLRTGDLWTGGAAAGQNAAALFMLQKQVQRLTSGLPPCALHVGCASPQAVAPGPAAALVAVAAPPPPAVLATAAFAPAQAPTAEPLRRQFWMSAAGAATWRPPAYDPWHRDIFDDPWVHLPADQYLFRAAPGSEWAVLGTTVMGLALLDLFVLRRWSGTFRSNLLILLFWILAGLTYNLYFYARWGSRAATDWCTGFFLEWMLSVDNLFVFHIIFRFYRMPEVLMHKALFFGILGAVVFRMFIFFTLGALMHVIHWVRLLFGLLLIYSGLQAVADEGSEDDDISSTYAVRTLRWILGSRLKEDFDLPESDPTGRAHGRLILRDEHGKLCVTLTVYVILCLEATDIVFAVDSVSAKVAQIPNQYVAYSSSVLALFGLRAMFFVVKDLVDCFELLKYGICTVLVFVGVELVFSPFVHLESATVCIVILSVFTISMTASTARNLLTQKERDSDSSGSASAEAASPPEERPPPWPRPATSED